MKTNTEDTNQFVSTVFNYSFFPTQLITYKWEKKPTQISSFYWCGCSGGSYFVASRATLWKTTVILNMTDKNGFIQKVQYTVHVTFRYKI